MLGKEKMAKRKAPRVVSDKVEDESTEDGLVCKRKKGDCS